MIGGDPLAFPAEQMLTVDHLVYDSARRYTEALAEKIAAAEAARPSGGARPPPGGLTGESRCPVQRTVALDSTRSAPL